MHSRRGTFASMFSLCREHTQIEDFKQHVCMLEGSIRSLTCGCFWFHLIPDCKKFMISEGLPGMALQTKCNAAREILKTAWAGDLFENMFGNNLIAVSLILY